MSLSLFSKSIIIGGCIFLSACSINRCNDYYIAYDCVDRYTNECREHYIQMQDECLKNGE